MVDLSSDMQRAVGNVLEDLRGFSSLEVKRILDEVMMIKQVTRK